MICPLLQPGMHYRVTGRWPVVMAAAFRADPYLFETYHLVRKPPPTPSSIGGKKTEPPNTISAPPT